MKCCINDVNFIRLLLLSTELFKFEIQKYGQILCVHKPYFLMPRVTYKDSSALLLALGKNTSKEDCIKSICHAEDHVICSN